jgi:hypothetical protein
MQREEDDFHLIDLGSQAYAVQQHLRGRPAPEKLAWLSERGEVSQVYKAASRGFPDTYLFRSRLGFEIAFFIRDDQFVFIGDNTTWVAPEPTGGVA